MVELTGVKKARHPVLQEALAGIEGIENGDYDVLAFVSYDRDERDLHFIQILEGGRRARADLSQLQ